MPRTNGKSQKAKKKVFSHATGVFPISRTTNHGILELVPCCPESEKDPILNAEDAVPEILIHNFLDYLMKKL